MIGNGYWSTGIIVEYRYAGGGDYGWEAEATYLDDGWAGDDIPGTTHLSTEGTLKTRYAIRDTEDGASSLAAVIDVILADAERLGITWKFPNLYYRDDGRNLEHEPPEGWRDMLAEQAQRLGWATYGVARADR
jgi:hypothetical protein